MRERHDLVLREERQPLMPYQPVPLHSPPPPPQQNDMELLKGILRHSWIVVIFAMLGLGGAWLYLRSATPLFRSWAKIYIEPSNPRVLNEAANPIQRTNWLFTQCELIRSAPVLNIVAEAPGMKQLRTFEKYGGNPILYLRQRLETEVGRKDDIITIQIESPHPEDAATIVNGVVDAYVKYSTTEKQTRTSDELRLYKEQKAVEDAKIKALNDQMFDFRRQHPNLALDGVASAEMQSMSSAYVQAQLATIDTRSKFPDGHPQVLSALKREEAIYNTYERALKRSTGLSSLAADYDKMKIELATKQEFAKRLDDRVRELEVKRDAEQIFNTIQVLETALVADVPSYPRRYRTIAVALAGGMLLGAGLALLRDRMDGRMRSVEEMQTIVGLPILGVVPQMAGRRTAVARAMTVHLDPRSVVAEAYRTIRTAVYFGAGSNRCKTILVTSPEPGDGKTTCASNLAIAIAQTGRSVLLLDADFRKPTQHKNLDVRNGSGLSSVLAGRESVKNAIQHTDVEGLGILPCGPIPANPSEILNSREFGELVDSLSHQYDHILFDSPPVNAVTDARILGAVCDATILVLRADKSTRKSGEHARNALISVGARVLGVIVNDAPHRKGYEVYGGSYYGQSDMVVRSTDAYDASSGRRALPRPATDLGD